MERVMGFEPTTTTLATWGSTTELHPQGQDAFCVPATLTSYGVVSNPLETFPIIDPLRGTEGQYISISMLVAWVSTVVV